MDGERILSVILLFSPVRGVCISCSTPPDNPSWPAAPGVGNIGGNDIPSLAWGLVCEAAGRATEASIPGLSMLDNRIAARHGVPVECEGPVRTVFLVHNRPLDPAEHDLAAESFMSALRSAGALFPVASPAVSDRSGPMIGIDADASVETSSALCRQAILESSVEESTARSRPPSP